MPVIYEGRNVWGGGGGGGENVPLDLRGAKRVRGKMCEYRMQCTSGRVIALEKYFIAPLGYL